MRHRSALLLGLVWILLLGGCALPFGDSAIVPPAPTVSSAATPEVRLDTAQATPPTSAPDAAQQAQPTPALILDDPQRIAAAESQPRDQRLLAEALKGLGDVPEVARTTPLDVNVGDVETFWVSDNIDNTRYQTEAELRYAGPVVLIYVDTQLDVPQEAIDEAAMVFEEKIYPRDRQLFGDERSPGIDGDPRITVLTTEVRGAGGYYSSADSVVRQVNRFSNEREMFVIGSMPGTPQYLSTLAHEFQHMISANHQQRSPSWFDEGLSSLAEDLNGYVSDGTALLALRNPDVQLTSWSGDAAQTGEHYGTSRLFMRYFFEQYAQEQGLAELIANDAGNHPEVFAEIAARRRSDITSFEDLMADWAVANLLDDPSVENGRYAYQLLPSTIVPEPVARVGDAQVHQYGIDYLQLPSGPSTLTFDGSDTVGLTDATPYSGRYAWWSNRGDDSVSTLTRSFDLSGVQQATLHMQVWYELETNWDYGYVSVSTDGGQTWTTLAGTTTTNDDPQGKNYGNGLNGVSGAPGVETDQGVEGQWIDEQFDLTPFAGQQVLVRIWTVTDDAYNASGLMIDDVRIPEIGFRDDAEAGDGDWEAQGFVRTTNLLPQDWTLRLVRRGSAGTSVERVPVDAEGRASVQVGAGETGVLVVMASTPHTTEVAQYEYQVSGG